MRSVLRAAIGLGVMACVILSVSTVEAAKDSTKKKKVDDGSNNRVFAIPKELTLTPDQLGKVDDIKKEQGPKIAELSTKIKAIMTDEQKAARKAAIAKAKADGVKGKLKTAAVDEAVKLTDAQKKLQSELKPELAKLRSSIKHQIYDLLADDQKPYYKLPKTKKVA